MILTGIGGFDFPRGPIQAAKAPLADPRSSTLTAVDLVDRVFTLTGTRGDLIGAIGKLSPGELDAFIRMTASLLKQGIVGIEVLEVRGERYESFITNRIGASDLRGARPYRERPHIAPRFQARA